MSGRLKGLMGTEKRPASITVGFRANATFERYLREQARRASTSIGIVAGELAALAACGFSILHLDLLRELASYGSGPHRFVAAAAHARQQIDQNTDDGLRIMRERGLADVIDQLPVVSGTVKLPEDVEAVMLRTIIDLTAEMRRAEN